jgi:hypothetical protein
MPIHITKIASTIVTSFSSAASHRRPKTTEIIMKPRLDRREQNDVPTVSASGFHNPGYGFFSSGFGFPYPNYF